METKIHPSAIIEKGAELDSGVEVGPFCLIGENVKIAKNTKLLSHVVIDGHTTIGEGNTIYSFASIGRPPQDLSYKGEPTQTVIGDNNVFREYISVHRGTLKDKGITQIGSNSLFMAYVHFAHDTQIGDKLVIANACNIAGHVKIDDRVIIGGGTNISQFISIGRGAYIGGGSGIDRDIPHFCTAYGNRIKLKGINIIGLKRQGFERDEISELVDFHRTMEASAYSPKAFISKPEIIEMYGKNQLVKMFSDFIKESEIGIAPFMS